MQFILFHSCAVLLFVPVSLSQYAFSISMKKECIVFKNYMPFFIKQSGICCQVAVGRLTFP